MFGHYGEHHWLSYVGMATSIYQYITLLLARHCQWLTSAGYVTIHIIMDGWGAVLLWRRRWRLLNCRYRHWLVVSHTAFWHIARLLVTPRYGGEDIREMVTRATRRFEYGRAMMLWRKAYATWRWLVGNALPAEWSLR